MMKGIIVLGMVLILCSCCCVPVTRVVQYRQVAVTPVVETVIMNDVEPIDVTTTTIDFY